MRCPRLNKVIYIIIILAIILTAAASCAADPAEQTIPPTPQTPPEPSVSVTETPTPSAPSETPDLSADSLAGEQQEPEVTEPAETPEESSDAPEEESETPSESPSPKPYVPDSTKVAYITIDDGPSKNITPKMLDLLAEEGIKATFFVLPHSGMEDIYQRIIDEGHEIGNHSYSHVYSNLYNTEDIEPFKADVLAARDFIFDTFGYTTVSYRFPGGSMGRKDALMQPRKEFLEESGYRWFDWNLSTGDADKSGSGKNPDILTGNVLDNIKGRSKIIILMHDTSDKTATLEALPLIIAGLKERGYTFDLLMNYPQEG